MQPGRMPTEPHLRCCSTLWLAAHDTAQSAAWMRHRPSGYHAQLDQQAAVRFQLEPGSRLCYYGVCCLGNMHLASASTVLHCLVCFTAHTKGGFVMVHVQLGTSWCHATWGLLPDAWAPLCHLPRQSNPSPYINILINIHLYMYTTMRALTLICELHQQHTCPPGAPGVSTAQM